MKDDKESLEYCSKCLFTASENIRECLDTFELDLGNPALKLSQLEELNTFQLRLEAVAQVLQKKARS